MHMETILPAEILWELHHAGRRVQFVVTREHGEFIGRVTCDDDVVKADRFRRFEAVGWYATALFIQAIMLGFQGIPCDPYGNSRHDPAPPRRLAASKYLVH